MTSGKKINMQYLKIVAEEGGGRNGISQKTNEKGQTPKKKLGGNQTLASIGQTKICSIVHPEIRDRQGGENVEGLILVGLLCMCAAPAGVFSPRVRTRTERMRERRSNGWMIQQRIPTQGDEALVSNLQRPDSRPPRSRWTVFCR